jgi:small multidrug resistance pump
VNVYLLLVLAILSEVVGTLALKASEGFSRLGPSVVVVAGYAASFVLLALVLQSGMPVAVAYTIWSAIGVALIAVLGWVVFHEHLAPLQLLGIGLVVAGVAAIQLGARSA